MVISPEAVTFVLLSFEGPDPYATAGGLGVRITHLAHALARRGFDTRLFFVGDPAAPQTERDQEDGLVYHRWCQWISTHHPGGVYAGEEGKLRDWNASLPPYLVDHCIRPAVEKGQISVILAEEWHTAESIIRLSDRLHAEGLLDRCLLFWNANNTKSFDRIDWPRLNYVAHLSTVSRYMKHLMWDLGMNPTVIPNGIPGSLFEPVADDRRHRVRRLFGVGEDAFLLFKLGRFDPDKRWLMAIEAAAQLKHRGYEVAFPVAGGVEAHQGEVFDRARDLGLTIGVVEGRPESWDEFAAHVRQAADADIYHIRAFLSEPMLRTLYCASDAVLANSGHEPFGLVGLEAMASGGLAFTGSTGEEYAMHDRNAIVLETDQADEITYHLLQLRADPAREQRIRATAREDAERFTWKNILPILLDRVGFAATEAGLVHASAGGNRDGA